ncbi:MAG TPA: LLM class flavin-dependent oxidoreductase, partial [Acidimicrobiales bacterium]|nr:LLM class flavin-dependent oxidoreductase [Acidimicrobiales bacterium]
MGVTLPQFRYDAETAVAAARRAEELGLDGVFVFDHMWPMGRPERPLVASVPLLGALAVETSRVAVGSLVMRVGLVPDEMLVAALLRVDEISGGRLVAGLGTGDRLSAAENRAFGVAYPPAAVRRRSLEWCGAELRSAGRPVWIGAGAV